MNTDINLLPQRKGNILTSQQVIMRMRMAAILCVMLTITLGIGVFLLNQANSPERIKAQEAALTATLSASKNKAVMQLQLIDRLNHIQTIITNRASLQNNIIVIQKQVPPNVTIQALSLDSKELTINVNATDLTAINTFLTNMTNLLHAKKLIKTMTIEGVVADQKSGRYSLAIDAKL